MSKMVYILSERSIHKVSMNIDDIFKGKIECETLTIYDVENNKRVFEEYIAEETMEDALYEALKIENVELTTKLLELQAQYEEDRKKRERQKDEHTKRMEYAIYLRVKKRIEEGEEVYE